MAQKDPILKEETVSFSSDSQLLQELGERLIATRKVALGELIKNAYDADATECHIWLENDGNTLSVQDDGHGMTESEFREFWMTIATPNRNREPTSRRYNRQVTGSKGVGRFAVRTLGLKLELRTVAYYEDDDEYLRLVANFDWEDFERGSGLDEMDVDYRIEGDATSEEEGTKLQITNLSESWSVEELEQVSGEVLDIVSAPYEPNLSEIETESEEDPGFSVFFAPPGEGSPHTSAAKEIYERYTARVLIKVNGDTVSYQIEHQDLDTQTLEFSLENNLIGDITGEIRYLPQRAGVFSDMETMDGRKVRSWLNENGGVRVIDNNFRMPPYGDEGNDWLALSQSQARRERKWRSPITSSIFPENELTVNVREAQLRIPRKRQLLGSVKLSSYRPDDNENRSQLDRLVPAMDRQGFVENAAFRQLVDVTRGSLEVLSILDLKAEKKKRLEEADEKKDTVEESVENVKSTVEKDDDVSEKTRQAVNEELDRVKDEVKEFREKEKEVRRTVESMNLLGVVSAFMSHETDVVLESAKQMLSIWEDVPEEARDDGFEERVERTKSAVGDFESHLSYTKAFVDQLQEGDESTFKARPQINRMVIGNFENYTQKRKIKVENQVPEDIKTPEINVALYTGVLINLYTNAIKAVTADSVGSEGRKIRFEAENSNNYHKVRVIDNGVGIDPEAEHEMFDPFFSTTTVEGPSGSGNGLGLYIVRRVVDQVGGSIETVEPPKGYETAFELRLRR